MVNPIVDWDDSDVWEFLNSNNIPHCCLYDEGFKRLGCIGCPLSGSKNMERDFARWPKYKEMYIRAFQRMIDNHPGQIRILDPNADTKFKLEIDGGGGTMVSELGRMVLTPQNPPMEPAHCQNHKTACRGHAGTVEEGRFLLNGSSVTGSPMTGAGQHRSRRVSATATSTPSAGRIDAEFVFSHWLEMGAI